MTLAGKGQRTQWNVCASATVSTTSSSKYPQWVSRWAMARPRKCWVI